MKGVGTESPAGAPHVPVLAREVVTALGPKPGAFVIDATVGAGGHAALLLSSAPGVRLLAVDRDPHALRIARERLAGFGDRVGFMLSRASGIRDAVRDTGFGRPEGNRRVVDGILLDLGVSSMQFDTRERGFSFARTGPIDMRMSAEGETAAELIDRVDEGELAAIFRELGELSDARRLARAIKQDRAAGRLSTTTELAALSERVLVRRRASERHHPATRVFQSLRMAVNDELGELGSALDAIPDLLDVGGVAAIISFHSLEDRTVKQRFRAWCSAPEAPRGLPVREVDRPQPRFEMVAAGAGPAAEEVEANPRSRSARLRAVRRVREGDAT